MPSAGKVQGFEQGGSGQRADGPDQEKARRVSEQRLGSLAGGSDISRK